MSNHVTHYPSAFGPYDHYRMLRAVDHYSALELADYYSTRYGGVAEANEMEARYQQDHPDAIKCSGPCARVIDCLDDEEAARPVGTECKDCEGVFELFTIR